MTTVIVAWQFDREEGRVSNQHSTPGCEAVPSSWKSSALRMAVCLSEGVMGRRWIAADMAAHPTAVHGLTICVTLW